MAYLNNVDFAMVHAAIEEVLHSDKPANEVTAKLTQALHLMSAAAAEEASPVLRARAHELHGSDEIEIDDEGAGTSPGEDGTWVQAWVWVPDNDL